MEIGRQGFSRTRRKQTFQTEAALVEAFLGGLHALSSPWGRLAYLPEFYYTSGRTDVVALTQTQELIAFEAKLVRWRDALYQAFRSTFFARRSYVVLPESTAGQAAKHALEFERRNVGLCFVRDNVVTLVLEAPEIRNPVQPWLATQAAAMIRQGRERVEH